MKIEIDGLEELQKKLKDNVQMDDVKRVVRHHGSELQKGMQEKADFRGHYEGSRFVPATGETKRSISLEMKDSGLTAEVGPETEYSPYVEYGTRFMSAQPFVRPAFNQQKDKFKRDIGKLMK